MLTAGTFLGDRAGRFAFIGILDAVNGVSPRTTSLWQSSGLETTLLDLGGISAVFWFALYVIGSIGLEDSPPEPNGRFDSLVLGAMALAAFLPIPLFASTALLLAGGYLFQTSRTVSRPRRISIIFLALTGNLIWGPVILNLAPSQLLDLDANLAAHVAGVGVSGNLMFNAGGEGALVIAPGCSSVHNMSLAFVLWASLVCAFSLRPNALLFVACGAAVLSMAVVNIIRLAAMVYYPDHFEFIHSGFGARLFGFGSLLIAGLIIGYGIVVATRAQA